MSRTQPPSLSSERLESPAAARNRGPILEVLREVLPVRARILELASGSGEHGRYFAESRPDWCWQPSDANPQALASIAAWRDEACSGNLLAPLHLDATGDWPAENWDAIVAINLVHISPWEVTEALMARAGERLETGGKLFLYGPYRRGGEHTAASNAAFDVDLKRRDPRWGVRDLEEVEGEACRHGLALERIIDMPANNLSLVFRR